MTLWLLPCVYSLIIHDKNLFAILALQILIYAFINAAAYADKKVAEASGIKAEFIFRFVQFVKNVSWKMAKLSLALILMLLSFSSIASAQTDDDDDYDFFGGLLELFGFGSSEELSFENKNVTSKVITDVISLRFKISTNGFSWLQKLYG